MMLIRPLSHLMSAEIDEMKMKMRRHCCLIGMIVSKIMGGVSKVKNRKLLLAVLSEQLNFFKWAEIN